MYAGCTIFEKLPCVIKACEGEKRQSEKIEKKRQKVIQNDHFQLTNRSKLMRILRGYLSAQLYHNLRSTVSCHRRPVLFLTSSTSFVFDNWKTRHIGLFTITFLNFYCDRLLLPEPISISRFGFYINILRLLLQVTFQIQYVGTVCIVYIMYKSC